MTRKTKLVIFSMMILLMISVSATAGLVPDTGQTICYDDTGNIIDPCPQPREAFYGQDANYTINPPSYTKLDADGNELADTAASWTMVRDNITGLIWEVKTDDNSVHDKDNKYTWYDSNPDTKWGDAGTPGDGTDTEDFINELNSSNYGGHSDWRLPTREELRSIINYGTYDPVIDTDYFPNTVSCWYWLSGTDAGSCEFPMIMSFYYDGFVDNVGKSNSYYARAVRAGQSGSLDYSVILISPGSVDFGSVDVGAVSQTKTFTITNTGTADLVIGTISISGGDSSEFGIESDECTGQTIVPSGTCVVKVVFSPLTSQTGATFAISGAGVTHYKYKLDDGSYSEEISVAASINLSGLTQGSHTLNVIGKDAAGSRQTAPQALHGLWTQPNPWLRVSQTTLSQSRAGAGPGMPQMQVL